MNISSLNGLWRRNQHSKMAAAPGPDLSYVFRCESCSHSWSVLSQGDADIACPNCGGGKVRAPNKRGTYKYKCDKCGHKWKKKNSSRGGSTWCSECSNPSPIFPYEFKDVSYVCSPYATTRILQRFQQTARCTHARHTG